MGTLRRFASWLATIHRAHLARQVKRTIHRGLSAID